MDENNERFFCRWPSTGAGRQADGFWWHAGFLNKGPKSETDVENRQNSKEKYEKCKRGQTEGVESEKLFWDEME